MLHKILISLLCTLFCSTLLAQESPASVTVSSAIADIVAGESVNEACVFLSTSRCDSTLRFAQAVLAGEEYVTAEGAHKIELSRKNLRQLGVLRPYVNITSESADLRAEAYELIAANKLAVDTALLRDAIAVESSEELKLSATKALYVMYIELGDDLQQGVALEHISESLDLYFSTAVLKYNEREDITAHNRASSKYLANYYEMIVRNNKLYQNLFSGLSLGSILVLISLGLSIVYGLAGIINMSHGEFLMIGAYTTYCVQQFFVAYLPESMFDMAFFLSLPLSFVVAAIFGLVVERLILRHLYSRPLESLLATLGLSLILIQLARSIFGDLTTVKAPAILSGGYTLSSGLILPYNRLFIIGLTIVVFVGVYLLFQRTRLGIRIRSVTQNRNMSACVGISTQRIDMITFMLGSGLAGLAGCAITLIGNVVPNMGQTYIVDSFLVVVTGGVGKLAGCAVSGLGLGVLSKFLEAGFEAVYGKVLILLLIIIFLQYRPKGLFADKGRIGDD